MIKTGDIVLVEDKKLPRVRWRLGLVTDLFKGEDGLIRGCKLRVTDKKGSFSYLQRPINQLCHFEVNAVTPPVELAVATKKSKPYVEKTVTEPRSRRKAAVIGELNRQISKQV